MDKTWRRNVADRAQLPSWCCRAVCALRDLAGSWELPLLHLARQSHLFKTSKVVPGQGVHLEEEEDGRGREENLGR